MRAKKYRGQERFFILNADLSEKVNTGKVEDKCPKI